MSAKKEKNVKEKKKISLTSMIFIALIAGAITGMAVSYTHLPEIPFTLVSPSKEQVHLIPEVIQLCMSAQVMTAMKALPGSLL